MSSVSDARQGSDNWGRWGKDDERGALNLLQDPDIVRGGAAAVRTGKLYNLGLPIQREGVPIGSPLRSAPQRLTMTNHSDERMFASLGLEPGIGASEDLLVTPTHGVTHMDALCHVYSDKAIYNGHSHEGVTPYNGAEHCGIEKAGAFATRGLLVDVPAMKGVDWLEPGYVITMEDVADALERQGSAAPRTGDVVLFRTGWVEWFMAHDFEMALEQPGIGLEVGAHLAAADVVAVGADNSAVEAIPFDGGELLPVHIHLLIKSGVYLIEHLSLRELSEDRCYEFQFVVAPLLITGGTASPVNPVAIG